MNGERLMKQVLPSVFFAVCLALCMGTEKGLAFNLLCAGIGLLVLGNVFLQNKIISRSLGIVFLLALLYLTLALFDDIVDGEATLAGGYWVMLVLIVVGLVMSVLLIIGYQRKPSEQN